MATKSTISNRTSVSFQLLVIQLLLMVNVVPFVSSQDADKSLPQQQQPEVQSSVPVLENEMRLPVSMSVAVPIPYQYQARSYYYPQQQGYFPNAPYGQYQQQYQNNFNQYPYQPYQNQGFGNPSQGFFRPPTTAAPTTTTAATTTTTTTTTPRPVQVGVSTLFPLVGAGTGFGRPGSQNILAGQQSAFGNGYPYNFYG